MELIISCNVSYFYQQVQMKNIATSVILLSTGRTGTMFFARTLKSLAPQADVYHEAGERSRLINILAHAHINGLISMEIPLRLWKHVIGTDVENCQKEFYIDSNNHIYGLISIMPEIYPKLKVIHIVRDPRSYVRSHINWSKYRVKSFIASHFVPFWQPNAYLIGEMSLTQWLYLSRFERFCWYWDFKNRFIERILERDVPYLQVKFEDFFLGPNPKDHLDQIFDFIGLPLIRIQKIEDHTPINTCRKNTFPAWPEWSNKMCLQLYNICGYTMEKYGYGIETEWIEKIS